MAQSLGERILILRRRCGLTQRELAKSADLNTNTIARLEQGSLKDLGGQAVVRIARVLDTSADYLLGMTDNEDPRHDSEDEPADGALTVLA
jgi:transcriptional regulator with XRE-family HTH domain